jgi:HEPN domain-containing protein
MKKRAEEWLKFSKIDIDSAFMLIKNPALTQSTAFHCHQAIEKACKAVLEQVNNEVPKIHDLQKLSGLIEDSQIKLDLDEDILDEINDVYIEARYPSDLGLIPDGIPRTETAEKFLKLSKDIYEQVYELLKKY